MTDRPPEDQAVHDRHPHIPQDTLDDAPGPLCVNPDDMGHLPGCPQGVTRCPRCAVPVPDLEQHRPVCTGPTEKAGTGAAE